MTLFKCSLCSVDIEETSQVRKRLKNSKSGLLFCSKQCKNEALVLAHRQGDQRFSSLVPTHYNTNHKNCARCGSRIIRKGTSAKFCGRGCYEESIKESIAYEIEKWINGELVPECTSLPNRFRQYLLEEAGYACIKCRWDLGPLEIDHINGVWNDHSYKNLRVLCPNCHSMTPNWKVKNVGNVEYSRYQLFKDKGWW